MNFSKAVSALGNSRKSQEKIFDQLIEHSPSATDEDLAGLAGVLAASGEKIPRVPNSADVASTGGPSSLTTLICPLFLRILGYNVPKIGVPGRPAGGIDIMGTIPGFRTSLSPLELDRAIQSLGFFHLQAEENLAPLDGQLFQYRNRVNAVNVPELAIASLLSKKIAAGLSRVTLEVRVWESGNLGENVNDSRRHAIRFCRVARILGIEATCVLTDGSHPYQPYIGRGEALLALHELVTATSKPWTRQHFELCWAIASMGKVSALPDSTQVKEVLAQHLQLQGTSWDNFIQRVQAIESQSRTTICALKEGFLVPSVLDIRSLLVAEQAKFSEQAAFPDPMGITLLEKKGAFVSRGQPIAEVRYETDSQSVDSLRHAMNIHSARPVPSWPHQIVKLDD